jgi:hypothetical protein
MTQRTSPYKSDLAESCQRLTDWWAGKRVDRVVASVRAPRAGAVPVALRTAVPDKYTDLETVAWNCRATVEGTFWGGEAIPCHWVYLGPVPMSAYFGGEPEFRWDTVWYERVHAGWDAAASWRFDPANRWWQLTLDLTRRVLERANGEFLVSGCGLAGLADVIANLWGSEALLMRLAEAPGVVGDLLARMLPAYRTMYDELYELAAPRQAGYFDWLELWAPGRIVTLQNDMSCMVSPGMFRDLLLDEIRQEARHVDYALYHLDGPGAIRHLDALLSLAELDGIQWVPGAAESQDPLDWLDLVRRIQAGGKRVFLGCPAERVKAVLSQVDRTLLYLSVWCGDEQAARVCLADLERIGI